MPRYPSQWLEELRSRADIVEIVGSYVTLKKNGHRYMGLCPFHNETAPSFTVDGVKQVYHCFGCKAGGSVIQFIMDIEKLDYVEAVAFLADRLHMPLPEMQNDPDYDRRRTLKERIYLANKAAAQMYHQLLWKPEGAYILDYLQKKRGLSDAVIRRFGLGAAPTSGLVGKELMKQGFREEELLQAGLMKKKEDGTAFDMFRNRAMFPIIDAYGNILGFGGRAMDDNPAKYLNTGDTIAFNKRYNVFAANLLRKAKNLSRVILVEGYMDVVALNQFGVEGVAATLGTALTEEQAKLLKRFAPEVHLAYDGDKAGQKAILRGLGILEAAGVPTRVLDFPGGLDPDEYIRQEGLESFLALKPISGVRYRLIREKEKYDLSGEDGRTEYAKAACGIIQKVTDAVERENYLKQLSLETGYEKGVLQEQTGAAPAPKEKPVAFQKRPVKGFPKEETADRAPRLLLGLLATGRLPEGTISPSMFDSPLHRELAESLLSGETVASFMDRLPDEQSRQEISTLLLSIPEEEDETLQQMAADALKAMEQQALRKQITNQSELSLEEAMRLSKHLTSYDPTAGNAKE